MSGFTKHMYTKELESIKKDLSNYVNKISVVLPREYGLETIVSLIKRYYPFEWQILNEKYCYYCAKDRKLKALRKKVRYAMMEPILLIESLNITRKLFSKEYIYSHKNGFNHGMQISAEEKFKNERDPKIRKRQEKISKAKIKAQEIEPFFLDELMGLYDRKTTSQKDRVYIIKELQKYYCPKVVVFFKKKVETEYNRQLREMAFYHLQELGHYTVLRKQKYMRIPSKNQKRRKLLKDVYMNERFNISEIPEELEYRIQNSKEQRIKAYDFFISHSSIDFNEIQCLIRELNSRKKNVYCDWINDNDYLKRNLVGLATRKVIEKRIEQSEAIILVLSEHSMKSKWVKYELNYAYQSNKPIYAISKEDISINSYSIDKLNDLWFQDENYKNIKLFECS
ncbi:toll/interleukin-1 receptor domain-containing protein [Desulfosporosinus sp. FKB]|uniref:toll/interleukin-1 receptor domain-containing protein n=1 Tax=Desulfosporosinus sp. FKB TaxID=1969835 RepID=UPI000B49E221|nr:toll/interleukin-1 receptor domain-containing protein [Desulfosporosinus sp. FKB]